MSVALFACVARHVFGNQRRNRLCRSPFADAGELGLGTQRAGPAVGPLSDRPALATGMLLNLILILFYLTTVVLPEIPTPVHSPVYPPLLPRILWKSWWLLVMPTVDLSTSDRFCWLPSTKYTYSLSLQDGGIIITKFMLCPIRICLGHCLSMSFSLKVHSLSKSRNLTLIKVSKSLPTHPSAHAHTIQCRLGRPAGLADRIHLPVSLHARYQHGRLLWPPCRGIRRPVLQLLVERGSTAPIRLCSSLLHVPGMVISINYCRFSQWICLPRISKTACPTQWLGLSIAIRSQTQF